MNIRFSIVTYTLFFLLLAVSCQPAERDNRDDRIRPWSENPRFWQYKGEPILLIGGSDHDNLFNHPEVEPDGLESHLDLLINNGGNYVRNTLSSRDEGNPWPWRLTADGLYDLDKWDPVYWQRFERFLELAAERDIIVQIEFWDGHDIQARNRGGGSTERWNKHPMNPKNNMNYSSGETSLPDEWEPSYTNEPHPFFKSLPSENDDPAILAYQQRFIEEVMSYALNFGNVLYVIQNESWSSQKWSNYWASVARQAATKQNKDIYIAEMRFSPTVTPVLEHGFDFAEFSQSASGAGRTDQDGNNTLHLREGHFLSIAEALSPLANRPVPVNSVKQYGGDYIGWTISADEGAERFWRSIFSGQAAIRFHRPVAGLGLKERAQANIRSLRAVTEQIDIFNVEPHQNSDWLLHNRNENEAYIMADPGRVYAIYFTAEGEEVTLDISALDEEGTLQWLNPNTAEWMEEQPVSGDSVVLTKPAERQWVAVISNR